MEFTITVTGLDELIQKVNNPLLLGKPLRNFFTKSALMLQRTAQINTPVDTGRLRASETFEVDSSAIPLWAKVGTNVYYGIFVEEDTVPHFPPVSALTGWANRHGMNPYAVAHAIRRRGTRGKHMFKSSMITNEHYVMESLLTAAAEIESEWGK